MKTSRQITDKLLAYDLNEAAHNCVRELAMACRKASIYGANHPMTTKAAEKPFLEFEYLFRYRRYVNFYLTQGHLFVMNFRLKESVFTEEIIRYMQLLEMRSLMFERSMTADEFGKFLVRFVTRANMNDPKNSFDQWLKSNRIGCIMMNSEAGVEQHEEFKQYRGDVTGDFSAKTIIFQTIGDDPATLADMLTRGQDSLDQLHIDFDTDIVHYLMPERIASLKAKLIQDSIAQALKESEQGESTDSKHGKDKLKQLLKLVDYHPEKDAILKASNLSAGTKPGDQAEMSGKIDLLRKEISGFVERTIDGLKKDQAYTDSVATFESAFTRMLRTGQKGNAKQSLFDLIDLLSSQQPRTRQTALDLLLASLELVKFDVDEPVLQDVTQRVVDKISWRDETFEYSALIWSVFKRCLSEKQYEQIVHLCEALKRRKNVSDGVTVYDSIAIKQVFANLNRPEVISALVDDLIQSDHHTQHQIRTALTAIGSEEVAAALSEIIAHPIRQVRQGALKVLSELGKGALVVFSRMLADNTLFTRPTDRHELPDAKWFVVRNSIFVVGSLHDKAGIASLRPIISDRDVRVRREVISALEKIGGEDAVDLLCLMADDPDREIRESSVVTIGLTGTHDSVPLLVDISRRHPETILKVIAALSKIGGEDSLVYLSNLLTDETHFERFAGSGFSKDDLHLAAIKALAQIGDQRALEAIRTFNERLSTVNKLLFRNSQIHKTISEILSK